MPLQELRRKITNGDVIDELTDTNALTLQKNRSLYFTLPFLSNNDTFLFVIQSVVSAFSTYKIDFITYTEENSILKVDATTTYRPLQANNFERNCRETITYYMEIRASEDIDELLLTMQSRDYKLNKNLKVNLYQGWEQEDSTLKVTRYRPPQHCDIPLRFQMIDGELPDGLRMNMDGRIEGVICNLDQMIRTKDKSPSFNWFFENSQDRIVPIGIVFRFKVKLYMLGWKPGDDTDATAEEWFCIRVHNNWSFDKGKFLESFVRKEIKKEICPAVPTPIFCCNEDGVGITEVFTPKTITFNPCVCPDVEIIDENDYKHIELNRKAPRLEACIACQDPTKPLEIENIILQKDFITPEDVIKYYKANKGRVNNVSIARLSNSKLFKELLEYIDAEEEALNPYSMIEMRIFNNNLTLMKFSDDKPLFQPATIMENTKNLVNQSLDSESEMYMGNYVIVTNLALF